MSGGCCEGYKLTGVAAAALTICCAEGMLWAVAATAGMRCQLDACCCFLHEACRAVIAAYWMLQQASTCCV